jgi:hypothetical protein
MVSTLNSGMVFLSNEWGDDLIKWMRRVFAEIPKKSPRYDSYRMRCGSRYL